MQTTKIDAAGHWLRSDAAASYNRMLAAGMPLGGISAQGAGRTRAVQLMLYALYKAGRGNLAAYHSLHELGIALDVTRGTPAQVWMTQGGDPWKVTPTGSIRANEYGWSRTVPSEPWHFSYDPAKDRHKPVDAPVPASLLLGVANCQSYDGDTSETAWRARGKLMATQGRTVWTVCETTPKGREFLLDELGKATGHVWKTITLKGKTVAVLFDTSVWSWRPWKTAGPWSPFGHGSVKAPLWNAAARWGVDVIAHHTRPAAIATNEQKDADIAAGAKLAGRWAAVIAGDFARNTPKLDGWIRVTPKVDTMDAAGEQSVDAAFIRGRLRATNARLIDPAEYSDHKWLRVDLTPGADPSL